MTKIQSAIKKLFPNSVPIKKIAEIGTVFTGGDVPTDCKKGQTEASVDKPFPVYSNGTGNNALYGFSSTFKIDRKAVSISSIGTIGELAIREEKFTPIIRLKVIVPDDDKIDVKYLYYILSQSTFKRTNSSLPSMNANDIKELRIPVPPLEIQKEIAEILDKFKMLVAELEEERQIRRKQYFYYSNVLFISLYDEEYEEVLLSDYFNYKRGSRLKKSERVEGDIPLITAGFQNDGIAEYISNKEVLYENAITIDMFGNAFWRPYKFYCDDNIICLTRKDLNINTAHYYLNVIRKTMGNFHYNNQYRLKNLQEHSIPLPFEKSKVDEKSINKHSFILGLFSELVEDKRKGLMAELSLRVAQYEYYRNELLSFEER